MLDAEVPSNHVSRLAGPREPDPCTVLRLAAITVAYALAAVAMQGQDLASEWIFDGV
jgi:hypothetical protein